MSRKKSKNSSASVTPEWSHKVEIGTIGAAPYHLEIRASAEQCRDVARRLKVAGLDDLQAELTLQRQPGSHIIHVAGLVGALVTQNCVITAEPLNNRVEEDIEAWYSDEENIVSLARARRDQTALMAEGEIPVADEKDDPEPVADGEIDVGELAVQYLSLAIDPYPQKEGAAHPQTDEKEEEAAREHGWHNPFAALKDWKKGRE